VDGLRAVAVVPVILFHAGFSYFQGGFVGVDVFFVISGYLITSIIYREVQSGTFSLIHFYERRIRRILPALFVVSLACIPFAWLWMFPEEFKDFAQSLIAINFFASNILFWTETGYFNPASELKPLLHTWSLAVEEQFYVLFPLLLLLFRRLRTDTLFLLITLAVFLSLGLAEFASRVEPAANFYLLPFRAWELGVGALLSISNGHWQKIGPRTAAIFSFVGLSMIFAAVFAFDESVPFPGLWALLPVLGTALVIACARPGNLVGRLLSLGPMVGIGLISYSAYLWHQPLFAFARIRDLGGVSVLDYLVLSLASLGLAYLTWRFVEQPFRKKGLFSRSQVYFVAALSSSSLIAIGLVIHLDSGFPGRYGGQALANELQGRLQVNLGISEDCGESGVVTSSCKSAQEPEILVWGDSYAMHLVPGIMSSNQDAAIVQITKSVCGPILGVAPVKYPYSSKDWLDGCIAFNEAAARYISGTGTLRYAVLSSPFDTYLREDSRIYYKGTTLDPDVDFLVAKFIETLDWLVKQGIKPIVFSPPPRDGRDIGLCLARSNWLGLEGTVCDLKLADYRAYEAKTLRFLSRIEERYEVIKVADYLCAKRRCKAEEEGVFIYRDKGHLSIAGSIYLGQMMNFYHVITQK